MALTDKQRLRCCVPFCRRTHHNREGFSDWICSVHWPHVSAHLRKRKYKLFRRYRRLFGDNPYWVYPAGSDRRIAAVRLNRLCDKAWERCKRDAIEKAAGI